MSWRRYLISLLLCAAAVFIAIAVVVNLLIDPYGELNLFPNRLNREKFYQLHATAPFKFARKLDRGHYVLVFGTSHSANISSELVGKPVLNLSESLYGNPIDVLAFLKDLSPAQISHIDGVYFDVDYHTLTDEASQYEGLPLGSRARFLWETLRTLDALKLQRSLQTVLSNLTNHYTSYIREDGVFVFRQEIEWDQDSPETRMLRHQTILFTHSPCALDSLREVAQFLRGRNIPAVFFNTAFSTLFLSRVDFASLRAYYQGIAGAVPEFYALMYLPGISDDPSRFRDPTHHKFEVTRREMAILQSPELASAYRLTSGNLQAFLERLRKQVAAR